MLGVFLGDDGQIADLIAVVRSKVIFIELIRAVAAGSLHSKFTLHQCLQTTRVTLNKVSPILADFASMCLT